MKNKVRQVSLVIPASEIERMYKEQLGDLMVECEVRHSRIEIKAGAQNSPVRFFRKEIKVIGDTDVA